MEKPRKKRYRDKSDLFGCAQIDCYNAGLDAMSTWLEGELPTILDIERVLDKVYVHPMNYRFAEEVHELFKRKLTGKVCITKK